MTANHRKLKIITLDIGGSRFEAQCKSWKINNNSKPGSPVYTYAPDGAFVDETDPDYSLSLAFFADWRSGGVSDFITQHDGETMTFQLDHLPDIPAEHVRWTGSLQITAPTVGGDARTTEESDVEYSIIGKPVYTRP